MADKMPNYRLEQAKLLSEIAGLEARKAHHQYALLELVDRRDRIRENWTAEARAIEAARAKLADLIENHGSAEADVAEAGSMTDEELAPQL